MRRCPVCRLKFEAKHTTLQIACSPACALEWVKTRPDRVEALRKRAEAKARREDREAVETPAEARKKAQAAFNTYIRERDRGLPCVSCGHPDDNTRQRHAGHYRPAGSNPALRFDERNCHGQCVRCNAYLSGNLAAYREELIRRIGLAEVERLEGPHDLPKRTVAIYREVTAVYRERLRTLKREAA